MSRSNFWVTVKNWVKARFWGKVKFWGKIKFWGKVKFWIKVMSEGKVVVKVNVCVVASGFARWSMSVCVWLHLAVSVDSADGAYSGSIR